MEGTIHKTKGSQDILVTYLQLCLTCPASTCQGQSWDSLFETFCRRCSIDTVALQLQDGLGRDNYDNQSLYSSLDLLWSPEIVARLYRYTASRLSRVANAINDQNRVTERTTASLQKLQIITKLPAATSIRGSETKLRNFCVIFSRQSDTQWWLCFSEGVETNITYAWRGQRGVDNYDYILIGNERIAVRNIRTPSFYLTPSKYVDLVWNVFHMLETSIRKKEIENIVVFFLI